MTLAQYENAEQAVARADSRRGVIVHAVITFVVAAVLIPVNVFAAPEFAWSAIAVACMVCGLAIHYLFGVRWLQRSVQAHQDKVERYARQRAA